MINKKHKINDGKPNVDAMINKPGVVIANPAESREGLIKLIPNKLSNGL